MSGAIIPDDWDGSSWQSYVVTIPDSVQWSALLRGGLSIWQIPSFWDPKSGNVDDVVELANQIETQSTTEGRFPPVYEPYDPLYYPYPLVTYDDINGAGDKVWPNNSSGEIFTNTIPAQEQRYQLKCALSFNVLGISIGGSVDVYFYLDVIYAATTLTKNLGALYITGASTQLQGSFARTWLRMANATANHFQAGYNVDFKLRWTSTSPVTLYVRGASYPQREGYEFYCQMYHVLIKDGQYYYPLSNGNW